MLLSGSDRRNFPLAYAVTNWRRFSRYRKWKYGVCRTEFYFYRVQWSVVVGWKVCPRQFVFPQQYLLRLTRTVRGVHLSNIECQMSNIKLTSRTCNNVPSGTTDAVFTKLPRPLAKDRKKYFSELATYVASFSVTYLATSLNLAKFTVTERTAEINMMMMMMMKMDAHVTQGRPRRNVD